MPRTAILHYQVLEKLGEGGMGVVYKAQDTRLNRPVALKVLQPQMVENAERRQRFKQEAQAASALSHPNIVTIYDIGEAEGALFIAMEYVAGKTLDFLIRRKGLDLDEALRYAVQIADALAAAHAAGIIHRDIKPANLMVTDQGLVKVLDFGLAKLTYHPEGRDPNVTETIRMEAYLTTPGTVVGTVAYMSPEQTKGYRIDARSDIFSFGAVLYEMVTGRHAFTGESKISILGAVLHKEAPPLSEVVPRLPRELGRIINRCLQKDPEYRFQHMVDVKVALRELKEESETGKLPMPLGMFAQLARRWKPWALLIFACGVLAGAAWLAPRWVAWRGSKPAEELPLTRLTSDNGLTTDSAISPDGKLLVYASDRTGEGNLSLWLRQVAGSEPIRLSSDKADHSEPDFSPDGTQIVFRSEREGGGIYVIPTLGGEPRLIARHGGGPHFSPDGKWIAYWVGDRQARSDIYLVPAIGGQSKALEFHPAVRNARYPIWSPDGKYVMYCGSPGVYFENSMKEEYDWWVGSVSTGAAFKTGAFPVLERAGLLTSYTLAPSAWLNGRVLFCAGPRRQTLSGGHIPNPNESANLWQADISRKDWKIAGSPRRLTSGTGLTTRLSVAQAGQVVFSSLSENLDVWGLPIDSSRGKVRGELERLTQDAAADSYPSITADGKRMVFWSDRSGNADIWLKDLESGRESRLTVDPAYETFPMIAPDGSKVAYWSVGNPKPPAIFVMPLGPDGQPGPARKVCENCGNLSDLSADGRILYYGDPTGSVISANSATGEKAALPKELPDFPADPRFSPDGRWVSFHTVSHVARRIFVASAPGTAGNTRWIPVTDGTGMDRLTAWSPDGGMLYFISERDGFRCIAARRLDPKTKQPIGGVFYVYHFHHARRSMSSLINVNMARLSVARDKMVFTLLERTGNIWTMKLP